MPAVSQFPITNCYRNLASVKKMETEGRDASNDRNPVAVVGLVVALLALLFAIMSYRRSRLNRQVPTLLPSPFIKACPPTHPLSLIILIYSQSRNRLQQAPKTLLPNLSTTVPPTDLARVNYFIFLNGSSNAPFAGANLDTVTLSYQNNGISRGDVRVA